MNRFESRAVLEIGTFIKNAVLSWVRTEAFQRGIDVKIEEDSGPGLFVKTVRVKFMGDSRDAVEKMAEDFQKKCEQIEASQSK